MTRRETGLRGEQIARKFLSERGYDIIETNYRSPYGEIDIIARYQDWLVFIEVRTKTSRQYGSPEESITPAKREKLIATAWHYQMEHALAAQWRIDLVAVELDKNGNPQRTALIENAVTED